MLNTRAIRYASMSEGLYRPVSMEIIVRDDTETMSASSCCVIPPDVRSSRILVFMSSNHLVTLPHHVRPEHHQYHYCPTLMKLASHEVNFTISPSLQSCKPRQVLAYHAAGVREILEDFLDGEPIRGEYIIARGGALAGTGAKSYEVTKREASPGSGELHDELGSSSINSATFMWSSCANQRMPGGVTRNARRGSALLSRPRPSNDAYNCVPAVPAMCMRRSVQSRHPRIRGAFFRAFTSIPRSENHRNPESVMRMEPSSTSTSPILSMDCAMPTPRRPATWL